MVSTKPLRGLLALLVFASNAKAQVTIPHAPVGTAPPLPPGQPHPPPDYMKNNVNNFFGSAPDGGSLTGPVLHPLDAAQIAEIHDDTNLTRRANTDSYWLSSLGSAGVSPLAPSGYQLFRNVKDFGAVGDGVTDDTAAINRAAATYGASGLSSLRCGAGCGSTTTLSAVVYFPPGTYLISTPIIQYYHTQFVGNPTSKPVIKGSFNFTGIALIDSDFYIPGGSGSEWYINQSNFYRQIRNFVFDMTAQNWTNSDNGQVYVPSGVHWQVGQATSITYCDFKMSLSSGSQVATAVGIYMENGSGGFVSDLTFVGGNIGFLAGSQQFTANNLQFTSCLTAIKQVWNWGFTWKNIYVLSCYVAIDCTAFSGGLDQGTGSITVLDSHFNGVPYAITIGSQANQQPNVVLDNLLVENSASVVLVSGGSTLLAGSSGPLYFDSWASGYQYLPNGFGGKRTGFLSPKPSKPASLLNGNGAYFTRSKPQYESSTPIVATQNGISNAGTGDQTAKINSLLSANVGSVIFFPAGIYLVSGTVKVPVGSKIVGSGWSQIMGTGTYFQDSTNPKVMVQVGNAGDTGVIEISDMLFTVKGPTAGAILMEWNVHEGSQGSAAMWDSHFRVGGASGTNLQTSDCPTGTSSVNTKCMAATMLMHVTTKASGYFENVWAWVADHDLDNPANADATESTDGIPVNVKTQISVYAGRGILIESQGPTWLYGTASEHAQLYQYQLANAANIYLGHMQTETPYYQPSPNALTPYKIGQFSTDPTFQNCASDLCRGAWALRVLNSSSVYIYSAGFYSFFQNNALGCTGSENCQLALIDTNYASGLWIYNIFTKGNVQIVSPEGGITPLLFNSTTQNGYTSEIAAWLALSTTGQDIGSGSINGNGSGYVTIDPVIWGSTSPTIACTPPCTYVLPPLTLTTKTTFSFPLLTTSLTVGFYSTITETLFGQLTTTTKWLTTVDLTTITIPAVTTSVVSWYDITVTANATMLHPTPSVVPSPFNVTLSTIISGATHPASTRTFYPPPWPGTTLPPTLTVKPTTSSGSTTVPPPTISVTGFTSVSHTSGPPNPICTHVTGCGHHCGLLDICAPCWLFCGGPPEIDGIDPNQPGGLPPGSPVEDPDDECETTTYNSCNTLCVPSSTTSSCSTSCRSVIGCSTTTGASSCQLDTAAVWTPTGGALPLLGAGGLFGFTYITGNGAAPVTSKTSTGGGVVTVTSTPVRTTVVTVTPTAPVTTITTFITTTIKPSTVTPTVTSTTVVTIVPTASAVCNAWEEDFLGIPIFYAFEVFNIQNWANDGGASLHKQEKGCGALTGWDWHNATSTDYAYAYFNLPIAFKAGCVERAIVSAGGPKIACQLLGSDDLKRRRQENQDNEVLEARQIDDAARKKEKVRAEEELRRRAEEADLEKRAATSRTASRPSLSSTPSYSYAATVTTSTISYVPQNWTGYGNTVTLTFTFTDDPTASSTYVTSYSTTMVSTVSTSASASVVTSTIYSTFTTTIVSLASSTQTSKPSTTIPTSTSTKPTTTVTTSSSTKPTTTTIPSSTKPTTTTTSATTNPTTTTTSASTKATSTSATTKATTTMTTTSASTKATSNSATTKATTTTK